MNKARALVHIKPLFPAFLVTLLFFSCKKGGSAGAGPGSNDTSCVITGETTSLIGNEASWKYEYTDKGFASKITKYNRYNQVEAIQEVIANKVVNTRGVNIVSTAYDADLHTAAVLPAISNVSISFGGPVQNNYYTYTFTYDSKKRIVKISEHTASVSNDYEWDVAITYNDNNNVTMLQYVRTAGPVTSIPPITVKAYDDKPTPYAGVKNYRFLMNNFAWDNSDPEPVLTALSANNPLDYTMNEGNALEFKRTMTYTYNEKGFPTERTNINKNANGEYTFKQAFTYNCK